MSLPSQDSVTSLLLVLLSEPYQEVANGPLLGWDDWKDGRWYLAACRVPDQMGCSSALVSQIL